MSMMFKLSAILLSPTVPSKIDNKSTKLTITQLFDYHPTHKFLKSQLFQLGYRNPPLPFGSAKGILC